MEIKHIAKSYRDGWFAGKGKEVLQDVNFEVPDGKTVGILGPSGSGKTTLANIISGLIKQDCGSIFFHGKPLKFPFKGTMRRKIQILYQHPETVFNPHWSLRKSLMEPYRIQRLPFDEIVFKERLGRVGIYEEHVDRRPGALSGGELQRAAFVRALALEPELLVMDEPTSMLDTISQAQILSLLKEFQEKEKISYVLITHHPEIARHMCHSIYEIKKGSLGIWRG